MASGLRINKAVNFAGKSYIVTSDLENLFGTDSFKLQGLNLIFNTSTIGNDSDEGVSAVVDLTGVKNAAVTAVTGDALVADKVVLGNTSNSVKASAKTLGGATLAIDSSTSAASSDVLATEAAVKAYVDGHAIAVTGGNGVAIDSLTNPLNPTISADIDGTTIVFDSTNEDGSKVLKAGLTIAKLATATTGYAASYQLQDASGNAVGSTIDIVKDQFLKDVVLGYGTFVDADTAPTGWTTTKDGTKQAILKLTFNTNTDGDDTAEDTKDVYILVDEMFHDKTAGNGIDATDLASNVITVVADTSDKIFTAKGSQASVMSVGANGIKATGIQAAIDLAVTDEHAKASAAVAGLNSRIDDLKTKTETAIDALDSAVDDEIASVESNVNTALTGTVSSVNTKVNSAVGNVNANVSAAVTSLNGKVDSAVTAVNNAIDSSVSAVNGAVSSVVDDVNGKVSAAVTKAVELEETTVTSLTKTNGIVTVSGITGNVLAVFGATGAQIYPDITKTGSGVNATNTLTADYGDANVDASWTILHTKAIAYTNAEYSNATASTATAPAAVSYTNAGSATDAVASAVAATTTTGTVDIAAIASAVTIGDLDYKTQTA